MIEKLFEESDSVQSWKDPGVFWKANLSKNGDVDFRKYDIDVPWLEHHVRLTRSGELWRWNHRRWWWNRWDLIATETDAFLWIHENTSFDLTSCMKISDL